MIDYTIHKTTLFLFLFIVVCVVILTYYTKKEGFGYYQNYFPPNPKQDDRIMLNQERTNYFSPLTPIKNNKKPFRNKTDSKCTADGTPTSLEFFSLSSPAQNSYLTGSVQCFHWSFVPFTESQET